MASTPPSSPWQLAARTARMNPSAIREILKLTERPGIISLAGGLPSAADLPGRGACARPATRVLRDTPREALQYAASEGFGPLREWVAARDGAPGPAPSSAAQVLITTGSQQGLDLVGKVLIDAGSRSPSSRRPTSARCRPSRRYEPRVRRASPATTTGPLPDALAASARRRALPLRCCPTSRTRAAAASRRGAPRRRWSRAAQRAGVPIVEDNPYGDLWFDAPPPPPLAVALAAKARSTSARFSKVLAPGLRLGYVVAPPALFAKLLQAKQAADLHTPGFNQRIVARGHRATASSTRHVPTIRAPLPRRSATRCTRRCAAPHAGRWRAAGTCRRGGMFFWVELPAGARRDGAAAAGGRARRGLRARRAVLRGATRGRTRCACRFVTVGAERIERGIAALGRVLRDA